MFDKQYYNELAKWVDANADKNVKTNFRNAVNAMCDDTEDHYKCLGNPEYNGHPEDFIYSVLSGLTIKVLPESIVDVNYAALDKDPDADIIPGKLKCEINIPIKDPFEHDVMTNNFFTVSDDGNLYINEDYIRNIEQLDNWVNEITDLAVLNIVYKIVL